MNNPKSKVIKSKSSNSAITTQCEKKNQRKKSRSNAEFQTLSAKKRGVYVDNKRAKNSALNAMVTNIDDIPVKPPRRPKPGSKQFLTSVLTILSKSTTGTQYPDAQRDQKTTKNKPKDRKEEEKKKYRSKVLNDTNNQVDKFEVLQAKKEIVQTPSMYSERSYREDINLSDLPRLVKPDEEKVTFNNLVKEVTEGKRIKEKKVQINDPVTLVSEQKDDSKLYNFFVDLLETTFDVYDVKANVPPKSAVSSIAFEIDESVARKLNVGTEMVDAKKASKHFCSPNDDYKENLLEYFETKPVNELPIKTPKRRKTKSFIYTKPQFTSLPKSKSANGKSRRNKKEDLLNILKEQLMMDHVSFEEPRNLYQALKVMAKNKKRQKIRFETQTKPGYKPPECMLKRRNIMILSKSSAKYKSSDTSHKLAVSNRYYDESSHSLEVYGFDYVPSITDKQMLLTYHSSVENSEREDS